MLLPMLAKLVANPLTLVTAASPYIARYIQEKNAALAKDAADAEVKRQALAAQREAEMKVAKETAAMNAEFLDKLLFLNRKAMYAVVDQGLRVAKLSENKVGPEVSDWSEYKAVWKNWNCTLTANKARVVVSFGEKVRGDFDHVVDLLEQLNAKVDSVYYNAINRFTEEKIDLEDKNEKKKKQYKKDYYELRENLRTAIIDFSTNLLTHLGDGKIGSSLDERDRGYNL